MPRGWHGEGVSLGILMNDFHVGEDEGEDFNTTIAIERIDAFAGMMRDHPGMIDFEDIHIMLLGDMVDGDGIHARQDATNLDPAIDQVKHAFNAIYKSIMKIRELGRSNGSRKDHNKFRDVTLHCHPGNHGRTSKTNHPMSNWDLELYRRLAQRFDDRQVGGVTVNIHNGIGLYKIRGWNFIGEHYGIPHTATPAMVRRAMQKMRYYGADVYVHGHYHHASHSSIDDLHIISGGSLPGPNSFSDQICKFDPPQQVFFGIREDLGPFGFNVIQFVDRKRARMRLKK